MKDGNDIRKRRIFAMFGALLLLCSACTTAPEPTAEEKKASREQVSRNTAPKQLVVVKDYCGRPGVLAALANAFQEKYPEYEVQVERKSAGAISGWEGAKLDLEKKQKGYAMPEIVLLDRFPEEAESFFQAKNLEQDEEAFIGHVLDQVYSEDEWMGVPLYVNVNTVAVRGELGIARQDWTPDSMMSLAVEQGVDLAFGGVTQKYTAYSLQMLWGDQLTDIAMRFAVDYSEPADTTGTMRSPGDEFGEAFRKRKVLGFADWVTTIDDYRFVDALFEGDADFVGFPSWEGGKSILRCDAYLLASNACPNEEGATKFLDYAASEDGQKVVYQYLENSGYIGIPVRRDVLADTIHEKEWNGEYRCGVSVAEGMPSAEKVQQYWEMLESAVYETNPQTADGDPFAE